MTTIADLVVTVGAEIADFSRGMDTVDKRIDTVSKSVADSLNSMGQKFTNIGKSATLIGAPFVALATIAVKSAADSEKAVSQLDAVLKSTESTMTKTAATAGHWAEVTKASGDHVDDWKDALESATDRLNKLQSKQAAGIALTESENKSIGQLQAQINGYQNALNGATTTQKIWVEGTAASVSISHLARQEYLDLASSLQKVTVFEDDAILSAENMLLTFTNIGKEVFPDATKTVLDMSQALGQDLKNSSIQLGKALNDPVAGITALSRVGVTFTEQQKNQIKALVQSGKTMEAQRMILDELQKEFGGSAEAAGKTFGGSLTILNNRLGDLAENLGNRLIPFVQIFTGILDKVITVFENASEPVQTVVAAVVALGAALGAVGPVLIGIGAVFQTAAFAGVISFTGALIAAVAPIVAVGAALAGLAYAASLVVNFDVLGQQIADGLTDALNAIKDLTGFDALALVNSIRDKINAAFGAKPLFGPETAPAGSGQDGFTKYLIKKGDTLYDIARQYGTSVEALKKANNLSGSLIIAGGNLNIPGAGGGSAVDFKKPFADLGKQPEQEAQKGLFTGLGQTLLDKFRTEITTFTVGVSAIFQNITGIDLTPLVASIETSFDDLDFSGIDPIMESHFNDILTAIVSVVGIVFGGPVSIGLGVAKLVSLAIENDFLGIGTLLESSGIVDAVTTAFTNVKTTIENLIQSIFNPQSQGPNADVVKKFAEMSGTSLSGGDAGASGPLALFVSDLGRGLEELKNLIDTVWTNIAPGVDSIAQGIKGFIDNLEGTETGGLLRIVTAVVGVIGGIADVIIRVGSDVLGQALESIGNALPAIGSAINTFITALSNLGEGDISGFLSGVADTLINIGQSIADFVGIEIKIPDFETALQGWQTFADSLGTIIQYAGEQIGGVFDNIAVGIRSFLRDIEETVNRAKIAFADVALALNPNDQGAQQNKQDATTAVQGSETAKVIEQQLNDSLAAGDINIDVSKFITTDPAAIASKIADPTLIQDALNQALAEGDQNAISVLLPIASELGIDTQSLVDQFAASLETAGAEQIYNAQLTADVLVNAGKVDLGPLRGAINAAIAAGNLAANVPQVPGTGGATIPIADAAPHLATGGSILSDGLAYLHKGEIVMNQQQQAAAGEGGGVTFNVNMSVDAMLAELERRGYSIPRGYVGEAA